MTLSRARDLSSRLASYVPADALEASHLARMRELCEATAQGSLAGGAACVDPFSRGSFLPGHFTASAFIVSPDGHDLLLIFHEKLQRWLQPGGHIDETDRDVVAAALREVREEVGIVDLSLLQQAPLDVDVHEIPARKSEPSHAHFDVRFLLRAHSRAFVAGSDAAAARWMPLAQLSAELSDRSVMRAVEKLRACAA
jgi:ADP-ribose pyrophosphatase YjhB (NUDIX family)